jgi:hypothetical protein
MTITWTLPHNLDAHCLATPYFGEVGCTIDEISSLFEPTNADTRVTNTVAKRPFLMGRFQNCDMDFWAAAPIGL